MIEQIIEKFNSYPFLHLSQLDGVGTYVSKAEVESFLRSEFPSYNKQLLDGIDHEWRVELAEIIRLDNYEQSSTTLQERIIDLINTK